MTGGVTGEGGMGGIDPHQQVGDLAETQDDKAKIADTADRVNTLPEVDELGGEGVIEIGIEAEDRDIPRPSSSNGEQRALQASVGRGEMSGPDMSGALGGSTMTAAVNAANSEGEIREGTRHIEAGGYTADIDHEDDGGIRITVTDPEGVTREGGFDEEGHHVLRTDLEDVGRSTVRFGEVDDGQMTVSVEPDDGPPHDLTMEVTEDLEEDLARFNRDDIDKTPDDEQSWVQMLEICNAGWKIMEEAIARGWDKGKPNI